MRYLIVLALSLAAYQFTAPFMARQSAIYQIHLGAPFTMVFVYVLYGWVVEKYSKKKWGGMKWRGIILLVIGLLALTLAIHAMGYSLLFF